MDFGDFAQAFLLRTAQTTALDKESEVGLAIGAFDPAVAVTIVGKSERAGGLKLVAEAGLDLAAEPVEAAILDGVFEAGVLALGAVAKIALDEDDLLGDVHGLAGRAKTEDIGEARVSGLVAVGLAHAAADGDVEAGEFTALGDGDVGEVLRIDVNVVARGNGDADFEFTREVVLAVNRFDGVGAGVLVARAGVAAGDALAVEPDFVVGRGAGGEVGADFAGVVEHLGMEGGDEGVGVGHDVAVDVAAGGEGVEQGVVDLLDAGLEVGLEDAVKLEGLAGGELDGAVGVLVGDAVNLEPLGGGADATGNADADHEDEGFFELLLAALVTEVAVVLLVGAVEFEQLGVVLGNGARGSVGQAGEDSAAQVVAGLFDSLVFGGLFDGRGG